jgi:hypothetical protein
MVFAHKNMAVNAKRRKSIAQARGKRAPPRDKTGHIDVST